MSSDAERNKTADDNESSKGETTKRSTGNAPQSSGHETIGVEKFGESGGSGGVPQRNTQGYEAMAHH